MGGSGIGWGREGYFRLRRGPGPVTVVWEVGWGLGVGVVLGVWSGWLVGWFCGGFVDIRLALNSLFIGLDATLTRHSIWK